MVFPCAETRPTTRVPVRIRSNAEIRTVDMGMGAIGIDYVTGTKEKIHTHSVLCEVIYIHRARDRFEAFIRQRELIGQPRVWHATIGVGIGDPATPKRASISLQTNVSSQGSCLTHHARLRANRYTAALEMPGGNLLGSIVREIYSYDDFASCICGEHHLGFDNRFEAAGQKEFFIARRNKYADMPLTRVHGFTQRSNRNAACRSECSNLIPLTDRRISCTESPLST
jgi:hypothetical protein